MERGNNNFKYVFLLPKANIIIKDDGSKMTGTTDLCRFIMLLLEKIGRNVDFKSFIRTLSLSLVNSVKTEWTPLSLKHISYRICGEQGPFNRPSGCKVTHAERVFNVWYVCNTILVHLRCTRSGSFCVNLHEIGVWAKAVNHSSAVCQGITAIEV